tara:strand:- start:259 stop:507 length:249 start_codon:yes stop_codon:yes gene_type:complete
VVVKVEFIIMHHLQVVLVVERLLVDLLQKVVVTQEVLIHLKETLEELLLIITLVVEVEQLLLEEIIPQVQEVPEVQVHLMQF